MSTEKPKESSHGKRLLAAYEVTTYISNMESELEKLESKIRGLPPVDEKGNSECPFAENAYADKEEAVEEAREKLSTIKRFIPIIDDQIALWKTNMATIRQDMRAIKDSRAKAEYISSLEGAEIQYKQRIEEKRNLLHIIQRAEDVLRQADQRKYPGRKPQKSYNYPNPFSMGTMPPLTSNPALERTPIIPTAQTSGNLSSTNGQRVSGLQPLGGGELSNLISMGPLGAKVIQ